MNSAAARKKFAVVGGDKRSAQLAKILINSGKSVVTCALNTDGQIEQVTLNDALSCGVVILPLPLSRDGVNLNAPDAAEPISLVDITTELTARTLVFGGNIPSDFAERLRSRAIRVRDYYRRDDVAKANAVPTAEGTIEILIANSDRVIDSSNCLVVGCGKCGRATALRLKALGAHVTVSSRKPKDKVWTALNGMRAVETADIKATISKYNFIINTVPTLIFDAECLSMMRRDTLLVEIASDAAGVDMAAAKKFGKQVIYAPALPGKTAPYTAAQIICEAILNDIGGV